MRTAREIQEESIQKIMQYCHHCICKTCLLAEVNGGAPGCGDCYKCSEDGKFSLFCNSCKEYYNTDKEKGINLLYLYKKVFEEKGNID